jgi:glutathione synthase/RimK-type ligase-like ATP-grasp enzyme
MQTDLLQEITRLAEQVPAFVFAFSSQGVDFHRGQIRGLYYKTKQGRWVNSTFPIPDVVYNRIPGRESESRGKVQATIGRLIAVGVKFFNPSYLNKWDCHRWLSQDPSAVPYLPDTRLYKGAGVVEDMLNRYGSVYLKPAQGSLGRGIIRLKKKGGLYEYKYDLRGGTTVGGYTPRLDALEKALYPMLKGKQYIVQQTLNLVQFQGNPFDIRVLMQKGSRGIWQRTKVFARVAQHGSITSNLTGGGSAELIEEVLQQCFGPTYRKRNGVWPKIRDLSRVIPEALEKQMGQNFAELGLDIGINSDRRVWLIEVNSKPWKSVTTEKGSQDVVERSILRPLLYARWLAGFGSAEGGGEGNG